MLKTEYRYNPKSLLNLNPYSRLGMKNTEEWRRKFIEKMKGRKRLPFSEEWKNNMSIAGKGKPSWRKGKKFPSPSEETKKKMSISHKLNPTKTQFKKGCKLSEEVRKKISEVIKGEKNWRWIKDRTKLCRITKQGERRTSAYFYWRKKVWERDNWKCRINNKDCNGKIIAHHILSWREYPELHYNINNGITLCHAHHPRKRAEEKRLIPFFMDLVPVSN